LPSPWAFFDAGAVDVAGQFDADVWAATHELQQQQAGQGRTLSVGWSGYR
jgi:hypothetical protein